MQRRQFFTVAALAAVAGCSSVDGLLESEQYQDEDKSELLPDSPGADWPDEDLRAAHDLNENFDRVYTTPDTSLVVMMDVEILASIEEAEEAFERSEATASDPREYPLADEAYISDDGEAARCAFRDSNALGLVLSARRSGIQLQPDRQRATTYAELLFEDWE